MKKIIISEKILSELYINPKEFSNNSNNQQVYLGNKTVTKKTNYNPYDLKVIQLMSDNPQFFVKTKITDTGWVVQEKINNESFRVDLDKFDQIFSKCRENLPTMYFSDDILDLIHEFSFNRNNRIIRFMNCLLKEVKQNSPELTPILQKIIRFSMSFFNFYKKTYTIHEGKFHDLHQGNLGYDKNGNIKIFDFINPDSKSKYNPEEIKRKSLNKRQK